MTTRVSSAAMQEHDSGSRMRQTAALVVLAVLASGCSAQRIVSNRLASALAAGGDTYASDNDPELVAAALPFSLKLMESVLASTPEHRGLLAATSAAFTQYAYAFVQQEADMAALEDVERAWAGQDRARRLYLRARDYGLRGLDSVHPGFSDELRRTPAVAASRAGAAEVDLLYWTAVAWAAAITLGKDDPALVADLPLVSALIDRAEAVDGDWGQGAIHTFQISYGMARPDAPEDRLGAVRAHFDQAVTLSGGHDVGPHLGWAEAVCLPREDRDCFEESLRRALALDADAHPPTRLANRVQQRRAAWLLANVDHWILPPLADDAGIDGEPTR